jgi:diguanylate cyclase (GGDEF)-like protein
VYDRGQLTGWRGVGSDITEVQRLNNLNARLALLDNLTGLANRNRLQSVLHDHLSPRAGDRPCGLILIDLQGFRMVNEGLGHDVGDELLRAVAQRLRPRVPTSALLARLGGDEFALLAPGAGDAALEGLVAALEAACEDPVLIDGHRLEVTFQIGLALAPRDAVSATELLKCAELALHEAKHQRSGLAVPYQAAFGDRARERLRLHAELKIALIEGQFELHYQPQIRLSDKSLVGSEALVRWKHPSRGLVSPAEFIPALEETGLIVPLGLWILEAACREALTWPSDQGVAVNVSAVQFFSRSFLDSVQGVLAATRFPAARLELEITESVMAQDQKHVVQLLRDLRGLGLSIALDDFGTGYSSLSYLRLLPLDKLKVDQSFVRVMGQDPKAAAIVQTVLDLSQQLGLRTTAEGVEDEAQQELLKSMNCDSVQGYLYSRPLTAEALKQFQSRLVR